LAEGFKELLHKVITMSLDAMKIVNGLPGMEIQD